MARRSIYLIALLSLFVAPSFAILPFVTPLVGELIVAGRVGTAVIPRVLPRAGVQTVDPSVQAAIAAIGMGVVMSEYPSKSPSVGDRVQTARDKALPQAEQETPPGMVKRYYVSGFTQPFSSASAAGNARVSQIYTQNGCPLSGPTAEFDNATYCPSVTGVTLDGYNNNAIVWNVTTTATAYRNVGGDGTVSCTDGSEVDWTNPAAPFCNSIPEPEQPNGKCDVQISTAGTSYTLNRRATDPDCAADTGSTISGDTITQRGIDTNGNPVSISTKVNPDGGTTTTVSTQTTQSTPSGSSTSVETTNITTNSTGNITNYNSTVTNNSSITNVDGTIVNNAPQVPLNVQLPSDYARENTLGDVKTNTKNIEDTLKGQGVDTSAINRVPTDQLDDVYTNFNSQILAKLSSPVGNPFSFNFGLPISGFCTPISWTLRGEGGSWDYCPVWDAYARPTLAFFFYALTAFFIYNTFTASSRGK